MTKHSKAKRHTLDLLIESLDEEYPDIDEGRDAVERLRMDLDKMTTNIQAQFATIKAEEKRARLSEAKQAYEREAADLALKDTEPASSRREQIRIFKELVAKAGSQEVGAHFQKYEEADDEELARMISSLRHLIAKRYA